MFLEPADVVAAVKYRRRIDKPLVKIKRGRDRLDNEFRKRPLQPRQAMRPVIAMHDQLGNQAVVIWAVPNSPNRGRNRL